jgi:hypothetical protein
MFVLNIVKKKLPVFMNTQYNSIRQFYSMYITKEKGSFIYLHELYDIYKLSCEKNPHLKNKPVSKTVFNKVLWDLLEATSGQSAGVPVKKKLTRFGICYQNLGVHLVENQLALVDQ